MKEALEPIVIKSSQKDYNVTFHHEIKNFFPALLESENTLFVFDAKVYENFSKDLEIGNYKEKILNVHATERTKSMEGVLDLVNWLLEKKANKSSRIVAIGGGCVQDLVSFTSHIYYRGIEWVFIPTTTLSQGDSCIGAKSGINVLPYKNQLGAIHAPEHVFICSEFLNTLEKIDHLSGLGEIFKLSLTGEKNFYETYISKLESGLKTKTDLIEIIRYSLEAKKIIIEQDELELDLRRILNYGHTFGHALETLMDHKIPHGIAVLWGIDVINNLGVIWGVTPRQLQENIHNQIEKFFDFQISKKPNPSELISLIRRDKKTKNNIINFAVLRDVGKLEILPKYIDDNLIKDLETVIRDKLVFSNY